MRRPMLLIRSLALAGAALFLFQRSVSSIPAAQLSAGSCAVDLEIPTAERETIDRVAVEFVSNVLGPDSSAAYSSFTTQARHDLSADKFAEISKSLQRWGPYNGLHAAHTYRARVIGGSATQRVVCGGLSRPEQWVAVDIEPGPAQAYVVLEGQAVNNTWAFVIWLSKEQGAWRVQYLQPVIATIIDKNSADLLRFARAEKEKGHSINSYILYVAALQLTDRGPHFQLGIQPQIQEELSQLQVPQLYGGEPPFNWKFGTASFLVLNSGPIGVGGKIYLKVDHETAPWTDEKDVDSTNRALMAGFEKTYPEYRDAFAGLIVTAHERGGNRLYGTVQENPQPPK